MLSWNWDINNPIRLGMEDEHMQESVYKCIQEFENEYMGHPSCEEFEDTLERNGIDPSDMPNCYWNDLAQYL